MPLSSAAAICIFSQQIDTFAETCRLIESPAIRVNQSAASNLAALNSVSRKSPNLALLFVPLHSVSTPAPKVAFGLIWEEAIKIKHNKAKRNRDEDGDGDRGKSFCFA